MTRVDKKDVMQRLRDNIEWLQKMYSLHPVSYQTSERTIEASCIEWTDEQLKYPLNIGFEKENGVSLVIATRSG